MEIQVKMGNVRRKWKSELKMAIDVESTPESGSGKWKEGNGFEA
jgi:hypothetical protein